MAMASRPMQSQHAACCRTAAPRLNAHLQRPLQRCAAAQLPSQSRCLRLTPVAPQLQRLPARPTQRQVQVQAVSAAAEQPKQPATWPGAKPVPFAAAVGLGLVLRFAVPIPATISVQAWSLLSIFVSAIVGLVLEPLPTGAWAFLTATVAVATKTLSFQACFSAFCNDVIWLIVVSFFFAKGFEKTGLGERVAMLFVKAFGKSTLGLAYGLSIAEALIAPAMPSTTARAGGIFMPIMNSLSLASGSKPGEESSKKLGSFLVMSQFQGSVNSSAMFLTAAAQNLLCMKLAAELGVNIGSTWMTWFKAAFPPAILGLLVTPFILYKIAPPEIKDTPDAPRQAMEKLDKMGAMSRDERIMLATMGLALALWVCGDMVGISAVVAAMLGLSVLLLTGVLTWRDCLTYPPAWDTLFWFAVLVGIAGQLNAMGVIGYFADVVGGQLTSMNLGWQPVFGLLSVVYFLLHYMFASQTAHVGALYSAFLAMMLSANVPGVLAALVLAYLSNLFGSITHYGSGQGAVYIGSGYLALPDVFKYGAMFSIINLLIWGGVGSIWWKFLGLY